jgi:exocyst complex component 1
LNEDIAFIEAQSQGLQVQTANQKLLQTELNKLVETISITPKDLMPLRQGSIGKPDALEAIERSLILLYQAMVTIDPNIKATSGRSQPKVEMTPGVSSELSQMRALRDKRDSYLQEVGEFLERLRSFMEMSFGAAMLASKDAYSRGSGKGPTKLDPAVHDAGRASLWQFSPLLLFTKEIDLISWESLIKLYQTRFRGLYQEEFRNNVGAWKKMVRKPAGEESELLFTSQEKEPEGLSTAARRFPTVKRSQTLVRNFRSGSTNDKSADKSQQGRLHPFEAFAGAMEEMTPLIFSEQNFIVDFFHASSGENLDFADAVAAAPPAERKGTNLWARKLFEPDRAMARRVIDVMDEMFGFWLGDMQSMVDWGIGSDPLQGVGILATISRTLVTLEETNQDFLTRTLQKLHERLRGLFVRFVDEQIRAIEDTKVKVKKRKGVIAFMKIFPNFSAAIENMLPHGDEVEASPMSPTGGGNENLDIREMIDHAYERINKAMFESLKVIAKESPSVAGIPGQGGAGAISGGDPDDKEVLNYHILLIENMNHYLEEVDSRPGSVLESWKQEANREMDEHMGLYLDAVIRRPLGKIMVSHPGFTPSILHWHCN